MLAGFHSAADAFWLPHRILPSKEGWSRPLLPAEVGRLRRHRTYLASDSGSDVHRQSQCVLPACLEHEQRPRDKTETRPARLDELDRDSLYVPTQDRSIGRAHAEANDQCRFGFSV